jgi:drug/metabolite transporter (DMT)-like permease
MTKELKADLSLIGITALWGASFPLMSLALKDIPVFSFIAIRYTLSALIIAVLFFKNFRKLDRRTLKSALYIGGALFIGCVFQIEGLVYTTPSKSSFITGLYVIFVPIIIAVIYKKLPDLKTIIGIILSIIGLSIMSLGGDMTVNKGDIMTLIGAVVFAVQILMVDKYTQDVDIVLLTCLELLVVGIGGAIPAAAIEEFRFTLTPMAVGAILFTAIFSTAVAHTVQNKVQSFTNPTHAAIIYLAEPVFGAIFSLFIGDKFGGRTLAGCMVILIGMLIINIKPRHKEGNIKDSL